MSIAPPSDIVLDVAQAADPLRLQAATSKLAKLASGVGSTAGDFDSHLGTQIASAPPSGALAGSTRTFGAATIQTRPASPYQKFEAVVLQSFVQNILPKDQNLFGDAASADACRSMLAEQLATQLAKSGKLGIAKMIEAAHPGHPLHAALSAPQAAALQPASGSPSVDVAARLLTPQQIMPQRPGSAASLDPVGAEPATGGLEPSTGDGASARKDES